MTKDQFSRCLAFVCQYWPGATSNWDADAIESWEFLLLDLDYEVVIATVLKAASDGREWPPRPGQLRQMAIEITDPFPSADEAWSQVRAQIAAVGVYRTREPVWTHPLIGQVAESLGWHDLCMSENPMADRAHFLRLWAEAVTRHRSDAHMPPVAKSLLASAAARGIALPDKSIDRALERGK